MVSKKIGGKWYKVNPGQTIGNVTNTTKPSSSGSSSSGGTSSATIIQDAIKKDTANTNVYNYEQSKATGRLLGLPPPTSNAFTPVVDSWYKEQQSKTGSFNMPGYNVIKAEEKRGGISKDTALKGMGISLSQDYQGQYSQANKGFTDKLFSDEQKKRDTALIYYQGRIDRGEDFNIVTGEYNAYIKTSDAKLLTAQRNFGANWEATEGARYKRSVNKIMYDQALIYDSEKAKGKVFSSFTSGAKTGAITTGGFQVLQRYAPRVAGVASKFVAVPVMIGYAGYAYGSSGYSGYKNYKTAKGLGFTTTESVQRGLLGGANTLSGPAFFSAGAVTGGLAVSGTTMAYKNLRMTGRVTGYSSAEQARLNKILGRKDAFKVDLKKGQVTDVKSSTGGTGGTSTRNYNVRLNTEGLSKANLKVANKFNLRGSITQQVGGTGGRFSGFEAGQFKTGGLFGRTTNTFTNIGGTVKGGKVVGFTSTLTATGRTSTLSTGTFWGKGSVKYPTSITRVEGSNIQSATNFKATYVRDPTKLIQFGRPGGKWTSWTTDAGPNRFSKIGIGSVWSQSNAYVMKGGNVRATTYTDTTQWNFGKPVKFDVSKVPSTKSYSVGGSSSGSPGQVQVKTQVNTFKPMAPVSTMNVQAPQYQATRTAPISAYAGTGQYELTQAPGLVRGPSPIMRGLETPSKLLPLQTKVEPMVDTIKPVIRGGTRGPRTATLPPQTITQPMIQIAQPITQSKTKTKQAGRLIQRTQPALTNPALTTGGYGFTSPNVPTTPRPRGFIIPPISLPMGSWGQAGFGKAGARKSRTGYNPSFTASFFKIMGKKPKGVKTGIGFRPIVRRVRRVRK